MTIAFSALSLKRNRSSSTTSKFNAIINKITSPFQGSATTDNNHKKRRQNENSNRRSSLSLFFIDYFRTTDENVDHPFANDALFEQNRYRQQKKTQQQQQPISTNYTTNHINHCNIYPTPNTTKSILLKKNPPAFTHHRHTNSSPSAITTTSNTRRKKSQQHIRHYSHVSCISSSNITVKSEDLTAKEFADIAGIRILSEDELVDNDIMMGDEHNMTSHSSPRIKKTCTFCGDDEEEDDIMVPSLTVSRISHQNNSSVIRSSNNSSIICPSSPEDGDEEPHIWDNQFWKKPGCSSEVQPVMHEYKQDSNNTTVIKKGRFEIHISSSSAGPTSGVVPKKAEVVEWKRKTRPTTLKHQLTA